MQLGWQRKIMANLLSFLSDVQLTLFEKKRHFYKRWYAINPTDLCGKTKERALSRVN